MRPKPTAVKEAQGSFVRHPERRNDSEPIPPAKTPTMPESVRACDYAASKWREVCGVLAEMGMLSTADANLIERLAVTYSHWRQALQHVRENGLTIMADTQRGTKLVRNPNALEMHACESELHRQAIELGLTPAARSRLHVPPREDEDDPFNELLARLKRPLQG